MNADIKQELDKRKARYKELKKAKEQQQQQQQQLKDLRMTEQQLKTKQLKGIDWGDDPQGENYVKLHVSSRPHGVSIVWDEECLCYIVCDIDTVDIKDGNFGIGSTLTEALAQYLEIMAWVDHAEHLQDLQRCELAGREDIPF